MDVVVVGKTHPSHLSFGASFGSPGVKNSNFPPRAGICLSMEIPPKLEAMLNRLEAQLAIAMQLSKSKSKNKRQISSLVVRRNKEVLVVLIQVLVTMVLCV